MTEYEQRGPISKYVALCIINLETNNERTWCIFGFISARDIKNWLDSDTKEPNQPGIL